MDKEECNNIQRLYEKVPFNRGEGVMTFLANPPEPSLVSVYLQMTLQSIASPTRVSAMGLYNVALPTGPLCA